jgi:flavin-dependent thymidylate synthase
MPLRVILAGHNLDRDLLLEIRSLLQDLVRADLPAGAAELQAGARSILEAGNWTPETLSAAYARVSRDPRSVTELRAQARAEVSRARRSNEAIIFGLGHASVAEHAVFNFDILGLSRLAVETLESRRLASYTEKSQRYILLEEDWVVPSEIRGLPVEAAFRELLQRQNRFYQQAYHRLLPWWREAVSAAGSAAGAAVDSVAGAAPAAGGIDEKAIEGLAKEDARYALSLATTVQLGETINARSLEGLIRICRAHPLAEVRELGEALFEAVAGLAPSLIKYTEPSTFARSARASLAAAAQDLRAAAGPGERPLAGKQPAAARAASTSAMAAAGETAHLVSATPDADETLLAALLFSVGHGPIEVCGARVRELDSAARLQLVRTQLAGLTPHDPMLREYEQVDLVFELVVSASCFAQLKRHRMASWSAQEYDPALGVTVPPSFTAAGLAGEYRDLAGESERCAAEIAAAVLGAASAAGASAATAAAPAAAASAAASYALTNGHRRRVLLKVNARELVHISRLRQDAHAQWEIRDLAGLMAELGRGVMPLTLLAAAGKDRFEEMRREAGI